MRYSVLGVAPALVEWLDINKWWPRKRAQLNKIYWMYC